jgi:hypothetical protein
MIGFGAGRHTAESRPAAGPGLDGKGRSGLERCGPTVQPSSTTPPGSDRAWAPNNCWTWSTKSPSLLI